MAVRAIRGATQVEADDREQVLEATRELVTAVLERNDLSHDDVISILFTATPDLVSEFPALAARELGMGDVPLMCATEIDVPHALPRVLRLMAHVDTPQEPRGDPARVPARCGGPPAGHRPVSGSESSFRGQITLDGPSGTGKSSVARAVAARLGAAYLDTGAMYRAATVAVLDAGVDPEDTVAVAGVVAAARIEVGTTADEELVLVDGVDVAERIRSAEVTRTVSAVSAVPAVRRQLVGQQRALVFAAPSVVGEGRDTGPAALPAATLKTSLPAAPEVRAQRRAGQLGLVEPAEVAALAEDLRRRDEYDSSRADSPLRPAADAVIVDSTDLDREAVINRVVGLASRAVRAGEWA